MVEFEIHFNETTFVARATVSRALGEDAARRFIMDVADDMRTDHGWTVSRVDRRGPEGGWFRGYRWIVPTRIDVTGAIDPTCVFPNYWP